MTTSTLLCILQSFVHGIVSGRSLLAKTRARSHSMTRRPRRAQRGSVPRQNVRALERLLLEYELDLPHCLVATGAAVPTRETQGRRPAGPNSSHITPARRSVATGMADIGYRRPFADDHRIALHSEQSPKTAPTRDVDAPYRITRPGLPVTIERRRWWASHHLRRVDGADKSATIFDQSSGELTLLNPANRSYLTLTGQAAKRMSRKKG